MTYLTFFFIIIYIFFFHSYQIHSSYSCETKAYPPKENSTFESYVINLDLPASQRWLELSHKEKFKIKSILDVFKTFLKKIFPITYYNKILNLVDTRFVTIVKDMPQEYREELESISSITQMKIGEMLLFNVMYEFITLCTSIIVKNSKETIYHARNLDLGLFMSSWNSSSEDWLLTETLKNAIVDLTWTRNNQTLFKSVNLAGYIGVITALKPNTFGLSVNVRYTLGGGFTGLLKWLLGYKTSFWVSFLTRNVFQSCESYEEAKEMLASRELLAPVFFILSSNCCQGTVITRSRSKTEDFWELGKDGKTFILQTNYDHWLKPPFFDNRIDPGNYCLDKISEGEDKFSALFNVLSTKPLLNKLTVHTTLMEISTGRIETHIQKCKGVCPPWKSYQDDF